MMDALFILVAFLGIIAFLIFIGLLIGAGAWISTSSDVGETKIKYRHFRVMYNINPDKWVFRENDYPIYKKSDKFYDYTAVYFGLWGTIAYWFFKWRLSHHKKTKEQNTSLAELISCFQKDLNQYKTESNEYIKSELDKLDKM